MSRLFFKRIVKNKLYWLSVLAAILLLFCSVIYIEPTSGAKYTFVSAFYDEKIQTALEYGQISMKSILLSYDSSYLWMFCPIIAGIPVVLLNRTERFLLFRSSKNRYFFTKYFAGLISGGSIVCIAYMVFAVASMPFSEEWIWDEMFLRKLLSVFCWGILCTIPSAFLVELVRNKYLILCIPFVLNYFACMFSGRILPGNIDDYISPYGYQILFLQETNRILYSAGYLCVLILMVAVFKKILMERRCDCGQ